MYPYVVVATALGYLSHLVLDSLTGPIPWGWPFADRRVALAPAALRIRTGSSIETWLIRPAITIAAVLAVLEVAGLASIRGEVINFRRRPRRAAAGKRRSCADMLDETKRRSALDAGRRRGYPRSAEFGRRAADVTSSVSPSCGIELTQPCRN